MKQLNEIDISRMMDEYMPDDSIWSEDDETMSRIKHYIMDELDEVDRRIILLYADNMSQAETAKMLGVSLSTIGKRIREIKRRILCGIGT